MTWTYRSKQHEQLNVFVKDLKSNSTQELNQGDSMTDILVFQLTKHSPVSLLMSKEEEFCTISPSVKTKQAFYEYQILHSCLTQTEGEV